MTTIKDVAVRAGVSPSTVSYALSGARQVSEETRRQVRAAVDALGYHPRASARSLRSTRTDVLALALPRTPGGYRAVDGRFAIEISDAARGHGYDVLLMTDQDGVSGLRRIAGSGLADGAVLMAVEREDARTEAMREVGFPTALLGTPADGAGLPWADFDWAGAAARAVHEAVAAGHREIDYLATTEEEIRAHRGYALGGIAGAERAAGEAGVRVTIHQSTSDLALLDRRLRSLLTGGHAATALVVQHAAALPHILAACSAAGRRMPEDLWVCAVGNLPGDLGGRALPHFELPVAEMAAEVVRLAVAAVADRDAEPGAGPPAHVLVDPVLGG